MSSGTFSSPVNLNQFGLGSEVNTRFREGAVGISSDWPADGSKLYFTAERPETGLEMGNGDIWEATWRSISFLRGDSNADGEVNLTDATYTLNWLFAGGPEPGCRAALNTNGDDKVDIADAVAVLNFLFAGGPAPVAPFPGCGPGMLPEDKELGCETPMEDCVDVP